MIDPIVEAVCVKIMRRSSVGQHKYGTTLEEAKLTRKQWLIHTQEELMDAVNYLEKLIQEEA